ncbi:MAG: DNA alkylation repair protein [Rhodothermales bacterium]
MTLSETLSALAAMGTAQNRTVYPRHGVTSPMYGVSFGNLNTLKKAIKTDHALAAALWATGNHDARVLATMIADPKAASADVLEAWANDLSDYVVTDAFSKYVARTPLAATLAERWKQDDHEWKGRLGWLLVAHAAMGKREQPDDDFLADLETIEREIHARPNRTRDAMNSALIAIGMRNEALRAAAEATAERIGRVTVDHGETNCKTPDAIPYIARGWARKKR